MKRLMETVCALALGALVVAVTAGAGEPSIDREALGSFTLTGACTFPVLVQPTARDVLNFFVFSNGKYLATGPEVSIATNLDSGKSVKINISGTFSATPRRDGSTTFSFNGPTLLAGGVINDGRSVYKFDANGDLVSSSVVGRQRNLCAELS